MILKKNATTFLLVPIISSITLIVSIALIRNTETTIDLRFGEKNWVIIKGTIPFYEPTQTKGDCLPGEDRSQPLNCK